MKITVVNINHLQINHWSATKETTIDHLPEQIAFHSDLIKLFSIKTYRYVRA